jgi:hypothetical protein
MVLSSASLLFGKFWGRNGTLLPLLGSERDCVFPELKAMNENRELISLGRLASFCCPYGFLNPVKSLSRKPRLSDLYIVDGDFTKESSVVFPIC